MAIAIAIFAIVCTGTIGAWTLESLWRTYRMMREVALGGVVPITITLVQLWIADQLSWYLIILSALTIIISAVASFVSLSVHKGYENLAQNAPLTMERCSNHHPAEWCLADRSAHVKGLATNSWGIVAVVLCATTVGLLWIWHYCDTRPHPSPPLQRFADRHPKVFTRTRIAICSILLAPLGIYMCLLARPEISKRLNLSDWGFGQIVAVLAWVAPSIELGVIFS